MGSRQVPPQLLEVVVFKFLINSKAQSAHSHSVKHGGKLAIGRDTWVPLGILLSYFPIFIYGFLDYEVAVVLIQRHLPGFGGHRGGRGQIGDDHIVGLLRLLVLLFKNVIHDLLVHRWILLGL